MYTLSSIEDSVIPPGSAAFLSLPVPFKVKKNQVAIATIRPILAHAGIQLLCPTYFIFKGMTELQVVLVNNAEAAFRIKAEETILLYAVILDTNPGTLL